ncbi:hypothetical protein SAMN05216332_108109 [Nitrosospira briensis]|nr:hypothetical protein SAMN05216332_108109 [Nitrosospira briensis]
MLFDGVNVQLFRETNLPLPGFYVCTDQLLSRTGDDRREPDMTIRTEHKREMNRRLNYI